MNTCKSRRCHVQDCNRLKQTALDSIKQYRQALGNSKRIVRTSSVDSKPGGSRSNVSKHDNDSNSSYRMVQGRKAKSP